MAMTQPEAMAWTLALELPVLLGVGWRLGTDWRRALLAGLLASGISHPLAWATALRMTEESYRWGWYAIELAVCVFEAVILGVVMRLGKRQACGLSLAANGLSAMAGRLVL
jgi:bacteriorhodopsin